MTPITPEPSRGSISHSSPPAQAWERYTPEDHAAWTTLVSRRMRSLTHTAAPEVLAGIDAIALRDDSIPRFEDVNRRLAPRTGWQVVPVDGYLGAHEFFSFLADRRFPSTTHVRPLSQLEYIPAPDIFHDVFGHVPLHADSIFADVLQLFGHLGSRAASDDALAAVQRLFWFTVEFGLVGTLANARLYGSGLVSSIAEERHALGGDCDLRPFDLHQVLQQPFAVDAVQPILFVVPDFGALRTAANQLAEQLPAPARPMIS